MAVTTVAANSAANTAKHPLRIGVLGAANINKEAIFKPCAKSPTEAVISALAARDRQRAQEQKDENHLTSCEIFDGYQSLLDAANIDAVYVPLPNGLHYEWAMKALAAGKHVLCEKPFCSNVEEAKVMVRFAKEKGLVLMEAAHWFYHPFRNRIQEVIGSGVLGNVENVYANITFPGKPGLPRAEKQGIMAIRYDATLAGGCMMDCGWYALNCVRTLAGARATVPEVLWAQAQRWPDDPEIDEGMKASLLLAGNVQCEIVCSYAGDGSDGFVQPTAPGSSGPPEGNVKHPLGSMRWDAEVRGSRAALHVVNYGIPHAGNRLTVKGVSGDVVLDEHIDSGGFSTYDLMVLAFCDHVRQVRAGWVKDTDVFANTGSDPIMQMQALDLIYRKAGLQPRSGPARILSKM